MEKIKSRKQFEAYIISSQISVLLPDMMFDRSENRTIPVNNHQILFTMDPDWNGVRYLLIQKHSILYEVLTDSERKNPPSNDSIFVESKWNFDALL
jgi:hypothetical protein